jgi:hypothetical protein
VHSWPRALRADTASGNASSLPRCVAGTNSSPHMCARLSKAVGGPPRPRGIGGLGQQPWGAALVARRNWRATGAFQQRRPTLQFEPRQWCVWLGVTPASSGTRLRAYLSEWPHRHRADDGEGGKCRDDVDDVHRLDWWLHSSSRVFSGSRMPMSTSMPRRGIDTHPADAPLISL